MIFVAHPIQTQAVTYTVQRYASMGAMFYMGSMLFYVYARTVQHKTIDKASNKLNLFGLYALSIACGMLAFLSKENTASLPGAILLTEYLIINGTMHNWKKKLPWFALAFTCWLLFALFVSGLFSSEFGDRNLFEDVSSLTKETVAVSRWSYLCTQFNVLVIYIRLLFLPINQNIDYLYPFKTGFFDGLTPYAFIILIAIAGFGIWSKKRRPVITFSIFYFFITLSIESSIIPIRDALFEHRLYLPMFGFGLFVSYQLFHYLYNKRSLILVLSLSIIMSLGVATYLRNIVWQDNTSLWSDVVSKSPHNYRPHINLGKALNKQGRTEEAINHYLQALRIKPDYEKAHYNLGIALYKQGHTEEAINHYLQALRIKPDYEKAHYNLGIALYKQGHTEEAINHYLQALRIKPDDADAHNNLGAAHFSKGNNKEAIASFREALRIKPDYANAHNNLGVALGMQGRTEDAINHYLQALRIKPDYADAHNNLGFALDEQDRTEEATYHYLQALRIKPDYAEAHYNLGNVLLKQGKTDKALFQYQKALSINPKFTLAMNRLAVVHMIKEEYDKAISIFKKLIELQPNDAIAHYNISCMYSRKNNIEESISWLMKAIKKGYNNWDLIKTDKDLENIRGSSYYKELVKDH
jgi:tetratricopeptide (TPR) repeat protein